MNTTAPVETPYWWEGGVPSQINAPLTEQPLAAHCDVAIIGAGYTGLSAALVLARAGRHVQVFDSQRAGEGASSRNGGIASGSLRFDIASGTRQFGRERAIGMIREGQTARARLAEFLRDEHIAAEFQPCGRFTGALTPGDYERMAREADAQREQAGIDIHPVSPTEQSAYIGSDKYAGGVLQYDIGTLHPAKYHAGLLERCVQAGVTIHEHCPVTAVDPKSAGGSGKHQLQTHRGAVNADEILFATNGYGDRLSPWLLQRIVPVRSRIVVTEPLDQALIDRILPGRRAMGERRNLYRYYRLTPDGTRLLLGAREPAWYRGPTHAAQHVMAGVIDLFPELKDVGVSHTWAGNVAFTRENIPQLFSRDGIHYSMAYCGSGTVWAWWLGRKVAAEILRSDERTTHFRCDPPAGIPLYSGKPWFLPAMMAWYGAHDRFKGRA